MSKKVPGSFGWFGGASDTSYIASTPVDFLKENVAKHGEIFKAKVASYACVFTGGYRLTRELFTEAGRYPTYSSMLEVIKRATGTPFLLSSSKSEVEVWRAALHGALYQGTVQGTTSLANLSPLRSEVQEVLDAVIGKWVAKVTASGSNAFYEDAKGLANEVLFKLFLGMTLAEADSAGLCTLQTTQFRGCEALPVEGIPLVESSFEAGIKARESFVACIKERVASGRLGVVGTALAAGRPAGKVAEVIAFLLHGMVPKAMSSSLLYTWLELTHNKNKQELVANPDGLKVFILECMRVHPPVGLMGRGVECPALGDYALPKAEGPWKAWAGIFSANRDPDVYSAPNVFDPSRWTPSRGRAPPPPLTFGCGTRMCPGAALSLAFVNTASQVILDVHQCAPVMEATRSCPEKYRPVKRPIKDVKCGFKKF